MDYTSILECHMSLLDGTMTFADYVRRLKEALVHEQDVDLKEKRNRFYDCYQSNLDIPLSVSELPLINDVFDPELIKLQVERIHQKGWEYAVFVRELVNAGVGTFTIKFADATIVFQGKNGEQFEMQTFV